MKSVQPLRLVKFDIIHPTSYLERKQAEWDDLDELSLDEYRARLNALRSNYSDYYTAPLNATGEWEAEEYYLLDPVFTQKVAHQCMSGLARARAKLQVQAYKYIWHTPQGYAMQVVLAYLRQRKPDVIFVRSQPFPSRWWHRFRQNAFVAARLSARMPRSWHPEDFDLVYTDQPDFQTFFQLHGVDTRLNKQGFAVAVADELVQRPPVHDVSFVGGLGSENFGLRTEFLEELSQRHEFPWWGYWWATGKPMRDYPALERNYQGSTSGLEMYQLFRDSRINLNDYVDTARGMGFNQRIFECLGCGGFLLTRAAHNFEGTFPEGVFATYTDLADCQRKIQYYLTHEQERRAIAEAGQRFVREHYNFKSIALSFGEDLKERLAYREAATS